MDETEELSREECHNILIELASRRPDDCIDRDEFILIKHAIMQLSTGRCNHPEFNEKVAICILELTVDKKRSKKNNYDLDDISIFFFLVEYYYRGTKLKRSYVETYHEKIVKDDSELALILQKLDDISMKINRIYDMPDMPGYLEAQARFTENVSLR